MLLSKNELLYHSYRKEKEEQSNRPVMRNMLNEKKSVMSYTNLTVE